MTKLQLRRLQSVTLAQTRAKNPKFKEFWSNTARELENLYRGLETF